MADVVQGEGISWVIPKNCLSSSKPGYCLSVCFMLWFRLFGCREIKGSSRIMGEQINFSFHQSNGLLFLMSSHWNISFLPLSRLEGSYLLVWLFLALGCCLFLFAWVCGLCCGRSVRAGMLDHPLRLLLLLMKLIIIKKKSFKSSSFPVQNL